MKRRVTIVDVAREAGVVPSTVSYVLNNTNYVASETKAAVFAAIEKLNYRPSNVARGLRRGKMMSIGVLTKDMSSPFHYEIIKGIEDFLQGSGYYSIIASSRRKEPEQDEEVIDLLIQRGVDGLVLVDIPITQQKLIKLAVEMPLVIVNRLVEGFEKHCIMVKNYQSGYDATTYLIHLGHTRIAHLISDSTFTGSQQRLAGYRQALIDAGLPVDQNLIIPVYYRHWGIEGAKQLFDSKLEFTAIFAESDMIAYHAFSELYRRHIRVPDTVSVIGHDDYPISSFVTPALTTMHTPLNEIGAAAAESILQLLDGQTIGYREMGSELVIRDSTGPVPAISWLRKT
jgi:LacI family transcriptional regulator